MKSQKLPLLLMLFAFVLMLTACTKQSLNEDDELLINKSDVIYSTGGVKTNLGNL